MISEIIKIIKQDYETVPYHNFWLILETGLNPSNKGGICTDRNFYLFRKLKKRGFSVKLHSAQINGKNIHQLIKIDIENEPYLIDVGLGWAIMQPIPLNYESEQNAFDLNFKTKIIDNQLYLYKVNKKEKALNYITNTTEYDQKRVLTEINDSYNKEIDYPFKKSIRFSKVVNNEFYFLKGNILFYSKNNMLYNKPINSMTEFENLFQNTFKFDLEIAKNVANKLKMFN